MNDLLTDLLGLKPASPLRHVIFLLFPFMLGPTWETGAITPSRPWSVGEPIVTYWAGPAMTDAVAQQMADGGWNLVWAGEKELDVVARHGMRAQLQDPLLTPASLDDPAQLEKLDSLINRVRGHPSLYSYFITDEPSASAFPALGRLVDYLRMRDPSHLAYINLFPTYATNEQLGNKGDTATAYREHLSQFIVKVNPGLVSDDHYQFSTSGDNEQYFLNLGLIRQASLDAGLPFLNIVQACTWTPSMRVPNADEVRYLVYTTLAYGAQGISYYVYCHPGHTGAIANADGTPTPLYHSLKTINREFVAIAKQLQPLRSTGIYQAGHLPPGTQPLTNGCAFTLDPPLAQIPYKAPQPVKGVLLGYFSPHAKGKRAAKPSHVLVVNLDYSSPASVGLRGPGRLQLFDATSGEWSRPGKKRVELSLSPGGGQLVRVK